MRVLKRPPPWEHDLKETLEHVCPVREIPVVNKHSPVIVNIVSTVRIIEQTADKKYRLPLQSLSMYLGACSQYAPVQFAANIIKLTTSITDSTALVFGSGNIVQVSALTPTHTIYNSQLFRVIIEQVNCAMRTEDGSITIGSLMGRTVFHNNVTHNIVGHGNLGIRIDLKKLRDENPSACKWLPDLFPALKCSIWLTQDQKCNCRNAVTTPVEDNDVAEILSKVVKKKCACTIKCLIFDSGRIVITGGRRIEDVNSVYYRTRQLVHSYKSEGEAVPREERFYKRLSTMMVVTGNTTKNVKTRAKGEMTQSEAIAVVLEESRDFKVKKAKPSVVNTTLCPLMRLADAGRLSEVEKCVAMDPGQLLLKDDRDNTVIERLQCMERTPAQEKILNFLLSIAESSQTTLQ
jgi:TATA-box binding protein (TBP) (component of TFIID and TFIIIB)